MDIGPQYHEQRKVQRRRSVLAARRYQGGDPRYKKITARMLLSHTSGFPNWRWFNDDRKLNINFEPGSRYAYSGEGIDLLQLVVETITNKPLQDLMRAHVFEPFGMTRSSMVWENRFESDYANGYDEWDGRLVLKGGRRPTPRGECRPHSATLRASCRP